MTTTPETAQAPADILDTIFDPEDLHPDLVPYLAEVSFGTILRHPLVYSVPHFEGCNRHCNLVYAQKLAHIAQAKAEGNWATVLSMYEAPYRLDALLEHAEGITDPVEYWGHVRDTWIVTEEVHHQFEKWVDVWTATDSPKLLNTRAAVMDGREARRLASLPPVITVWRGAGRKRWARSGMSWSLDQGTAEWFAWRYREGADVPSCARGTIAREDVIALFLSRGELEIVADPESVTVQEIYPAPRTIKKPEPLWKFVKSPPTS